MREKIAIVHDALVNMGGAERVVGLFHQFFPDAPLYTSAYNPKKTYNIFKGAKIKTTCAQIASKNEMMVKFMLPFCLRGMSRFDLRDYDIVLSSATWCAKNINPRNDALYICYCYIPFRLLWNTEDYFLDKPKDRMLKKALSPWITVLRQQDFEAAQRVNYFLTSCENTAKKIRDCYKRDAEVIHPPVDLERFKASNETSDYFLIVSRLVPYKRIDIAIEAFNELGFPLKIVGDGPQRKELQLRANENIQFLGNITDSEMVDLYQKAQALIHPAEEDYGIVPLEAQASGRPVIAYGAGGVLETVVPCEGDSKKYTGMPTGIFFSKQDKDSLVEAVRKFKPSDFDSSVIREHAANFDAAIFKKKILDFIKEKAVLANLDVSQING